MTPRSGPKSLQTPLAGARRLADRWPGAQLQITADHDHHRILWADWTRDQVVEFLRR